MLKTSFYFNKFTLYYLSDTVSLSFPISYVKLKCINSKCNCLLQGIVIKYFTIVMEGILFKLLLWNSIMAVLTKNIYILSLV